MDHPVHGDLAVRAGRVQGQRRLQRGGLQLVDPHRARERVLAQLRDQVGATDDAAGLGAAEELVAAERDEVGAVGQRLVHARLLAGEPALGVQQARADIEHERHPGLRGELGELGGRRRGREPDHAVVRRVHLQDRGGRVLDRGAEVGRTGAVRRADLDQACAGGAHDVGDPELAADLDQLAARDEHLLALGERGQREHQRRRAVVHDERGLGAGDRAQEELSCAPRGIRDCRSCGRPRGRCSAAAARPTASTARSASGARPRFVCRTTPVALITRVWPLVARAAAGHGQGEDLVGDRRFLASCGALPDGLELGGQRALEHGAADDARGALARGGTQHRVDARDLASGVGGCHGSEPIAARSGDGSPCRPATR